MKDGRLSRRKSIKIILTKASGNSNSSYRKGSRTGNSSSSSSGQRSMMVLSRKMHSIEGQTGVVVVYPLG